MNQADSRIRREAHLWRARRDDGVNEAQQAEFQRWIQSDPSHAEAYAEAELLWHGLSTAAVGTALERHIKFQSDSQPTPSRVQFASWMQTGFGFAVAAMLALVVTMMYLDRPTLEPEPGPLPEIVRYQTEFGETKAFELDDGSQLTLGAKSMLTVELSTDTRAVELLDGSAFFSVVHDPMRPFIVRTGAAEVRVTGTSFDLQRKHSVLHVAVQEGSVELSHPFVVAGVIESNHPQGWQRRNGDVIQTRGLSAGQAVIASQEEGIGDTRAVEPNQIGAWRDGQLVYLRATLAEIAADLNRYRARPLVLDEGVESLRLSGTFGVDDIDQLLNTLELALPVQITELDNHDLIELNR